jgi:hypothetical protein
LGVITTHGPSEHVALLGASSHKGKVASAQFVVDFIRASTQVEEVGKQRLGALLHVVVPLLPGGLDENAGDFEEPIFK